MTREEEKLLREFAATTHEDHVRDKMLNTLTLYAVVQALCSVALKQEAIKKAQGAP